MVGKEFITQELLSDWRNTIGLWVNMADDRGAKSVIVVYDSNDLEFKPFFVFPEQSVPIVARTLPNGLKAIAIITQDEDRLFDSALLSICHFFSDIVEN